MKCGSLFSGIGGMDLGLEWAGCEIIWQSEIDPYASKVLKKHWPAIPNLGDVTQIDWSRVERPDLVCGGFPCQPVSVTGKRAGTEDVRWLWPEFFRCICALRPRYALIENVPGLFSCGFGDVLADLAAGGFDAEWNCLSAASLGAPQIRNRVWILAYPKGQRRGAGLRSSGLFGEVRPEQVTQLGDSGQIRNANGERLEEQRLVFPAGPGRTGFECSDWWTLEPDVGRMAPGIPRRVDRLRCLGNSVVPQVAEWVGRRIMETAA